MPSLNQQKGQENENKVLKFFEDQGYQLIDQNSKVYGVEIDLIFKKSDVVYFVEVKSDNQWRLERPLSFTQWSRLTEAVLMWSEERQCSVQLLLAIVDFMGQKIQVFPLDEYLDTKN